jgi:hypothetical protein
MNILEAIQSKQLFAKWFQPRRKWFGTKQQDSWKPWRVFLASLYGLAIDDESMEIYKRHTGREDVNGDGYREAYCVVGRRGGKSLISALVAVYEACFVDHTESLAPGETGVVMVICADRAQGRIILGYIESFLTQVPVLKKMVRNVLKESIELTCNVRIEIRTADFRSIRGYSVLCAICDELAFFQDVNSAIPAVEILNALKPSLLTTNGLLLGISSPYSRSGPLHDSYTTYFGKPGADVLVWTGTTLQMNCTVNEKVIRAAFARDPVSAECEYNAQFRSDLESFVSREAVEACVVRGRYELPYVKAMDYVAFTDPSGGRSDSFTLAIAHAEDEVTVLDFLGERPAPFSPEESVAVFANILKRYHVCEVTGDRYAGAWPEEAFAKHGITYRTSEKDRSSLYVEFLPQIMSAQTQLLDDARISTQLTGLERRCGRGKDIVDHRAGSHDDCSNVIAGALVLAAANAGGGWGWITYIKEIVSGVRANPLDRPLPQVSRDVFGQIQDNPRNDNLNAAKNWELERRLRGLDLGTLNPASEDVWKPKTPPCVSCGNKATVKLGAAVHCNQCGHDDFPDGKPKSMYCGRNGPMWR